MAVVVVVLEELGGMHLRHLAREVVVLEELVYSQV
jgi:hypothetical protein